VSDVVVSREVVSRDVAESPRRDVDSATCALSAVALGWRSRVGRVGRAGDAALVEPLSEDTLDPPEPVVSARANGIDPSTAEPMPRATARAPIRPTWRA
jgi:hypothetical protein